MYELPLFPLNTVLFPGMPLELHIFETRYQEMINLCIEQRQPFGVVLIRRGRAESGPLPEPYSVGCTAQITEVHPLGQGRMNIHAIGHERFQVISLKRDKAYLVGMAETYPLENSTATTLFPLARKLHPLVEQFLKLMDTAGQLRFQAQQIPRDPLSLAYLACILLQVPPVQQKALLATLINSNTQGRDPYDITFRSFIAQQQALLESSDGLTLLDDLCRIYRREIVLVDSMLKSPDKDEKITPFSQN